MASRNLQIVKIVNALKPINADPHIISGDFLYFPG